MPKDLQDHTADRFTPLGALSNAASRLSLHTAEEHQELSALDLERHYLAACQKLEQLVERKRRAEEKV